MEDISIVRSDRFDNFSDYFKSYINRVKDLELMLVLEDQVKTFNELLEKLNEEQSEYRYAAGKWSIKEMILHISDTERIMSYRALRAARNDSMMLASFDENAFVSESFASERSFKSILKDWNSVRHSVITLFTDLNEIQLARLGKFSGSELSVEGIGYLIAGHLAHHEEVLKNRYGFWEKGE